MPNDSIMYISLRGKALHHHFNLDALELTKEVCTCVKKGNPLPSIEEIRAFCKESKFFVNVISGETGEVLEIVYLDKESYIASIEEYQEENETGNYISVHER